MKFNSTRGKIRGLTFEQGILIGYASDGGLVMPEYIPQVDLNVISSWKDKSFVDLACEILSLFISDDEVTKTQLKDLILKAYGKDFSCPIKHLTDNLQVLELFHGKTKAFKDVSLALLAQFLELFLEKQDKHSTVLVGTSGDTGSAAIESVRNLKHIDIVVLFPKGYCTKVQELQMTTVLDKNVHVYGVEGSSDDLDVPIKQCTLDKEFVDKYNIGCLNSINLGRILVQIIHFFYAYLKVCKKVGEKVKIVVPTGAMGNVTGGCIAKKMGLPIMLQICVNDNKCIFEALTTGTYKNHPNVTKTWSPAMDISCAYNIERILYLFSDMNASLVDSLMSSYEENGTVDIPSQLREKIAETITCDWVCQDEGLATMKTIFEMYQYVLCPHSAVGVAVALRDRRNEEDREVCVCIATASPAKFQDAVKAANIEYTPPPEILKLDSMPTRYEHMNKGEDWEGILRRKIIAIGDGRY